MNAITINDKKLPIKEYGGERVVTFKDIDAVHGRPDGTARKRFNDNKMHFIEGLDYFKVKCWEVRPFFGQTLPNGFNPNADIILITESGYLMLVKSFTDDLAWDVQRQLVSCYFRVKSPEPEQHIPDAVETSEYHYFKKTLNGEPVITLADFSHYTGVNICAARHAIYLIGKEGADYTLLSKRVLAMFKVENPSFSKSINSLVVIKKPGVEKLAKYYGCGSKLPEMIEARKSNPDRLPTTEVKELMEKVQNEAQAIDGISHLLLCPNTEKSFNEYRGLLIERIIKLYRYQVEIAFAKN